MAKENAQNLIETSDYIGHHLVNLTFGGVKNIFLGLCQSSAGTFQGLDSACKVSEMGFWSFHLDTIFMSILLGQLSLDSSALLTRLPKKECLASYKTLPNSFTSLSPAQSIQAITALLK